MDAAYGDPDLRELLMSGKKIHGIFGTYVFPPLTYEEIAATKHEKGEKNLYGRAKAGVFALAYGGEAYTLHTRMGVDEDVAQEAYTNWCNRFKVWGEARQRAFDRFCSMRQPGGIGSRVVWNDPDDYAESMLGFRRYFTLENQIVKALFDMANKMPEELKGIKVKVQRRDRIQSASGAACSALYAAAFNIQQQNMRAAANHEIQSSGAGLTKKLQCRIWSLQPAGITEWKVVPMNIHDEVMAPVKPDLSDQLYAIVTAFVEEHKTLVPLLEIAWHQGMTDWSGK
jgi:DNA polymerase I-like protein with 3'-5' exonuclease and polymerase domains